MKVLEGAPVHIKQDKLLSAIISFCESSGAAMAAWKLPGEDSYQLIIDLDGADVIATSSIENLESGFLFAPFERSDDKLLIRTQLSVNLENANISGEDLHTEPLIRYINDYGAGSKSKEQSQTIVHVQESDSENFMGLIEAAVAGITEGIFQKVVPSRFKTIELNTAFDIGRFFYDLANTYQNAFVSLVYDVRCGLWIGATPELLLEVKNKTFKTVSLAGTQRFDGQPLSEVAWTQKEIEEQALVSRYIINCFKKIRLREFEENGPKTVKAGNLIHLKTEFKVDMLATNFPDLGSVMLDLLHPTSAICGMPLDPALEFLNQHEGYDREYFSGFLGPVNIKNSTTLFVNLRCMKVQGKYAYLYAGAGITEDSIPSKEWQETEMKMNTLLNLII